MNRNPIMLLCAAALAGFPTGRALRAQDPAGQLRDAGQPGPASPVTPAAPANGDGSLADRVTGYRSGIIGSVHDFSDPQGGPGNACSACHVPHMQGLRPTSQPSTQPAAEMFRLAGQRRIFVPDRYTPGPSSLICLGCHDGTVATSTIGSSHSMLAGVREGFSVPKDFVWRDHPIGIPYPTGNRREYRPIAFVEKTSVRLPEGRIECISCHDPHHTTGLDDLLVMSNRRSTLCLSCHVK